MDETTIISCIVGAIIVIMIIVFLMHKKEGYGEKKNIPIVSFVATSEIAPHINPTFAFVLVDGIQAKVGEARFSYMVLPSLPYISDPKDNFQVTVSMPGKVTLTHSFFLDFDHRMKDSEKHVLNIKHAKRISNAISKCS